jgi:hypothetical protein
MSSIAVAKIGPVALLADMEEWRYGCTHNFDIRRRLVISFIVKGMPCTC